MGGTMLKVMGSLLIALLLIACSGANYSSGTPSSVETQNSIAGIVLLPNGTPASYARLSLFPADDQTAIIPTQTQCDQRGAFKIAVPDSAVYSLVVDGDAGYTGRFLLNADSPNDSSLQLDTIRSLFVAVRPGFFGENSALVLQVLGTPVTLNWNASAPTRLDLPGNGSYAIAVSNGVDQRIAIANIAESTDTVWLEIPSIPSINLLDFEEKCYQNNLYTLFGESWNFYMDGNDTLKPSGTNIDFGTTCVSDPIHGTVSHIQFQPSHANSWFVLGTGFGDASIGADLSSLDSLVFWAKGTCDLNVGFVTENMRTFYDYEYPKAPEFALSENWSRYSIPSTSLSFAVESEGYQKQFTWLSSSTRTLLVQWSSTSACDFWLDDVQLIGISYPEMKINP